MFALFLRGELPHTGRGYGCVQGLGQRAGLGGVPTPLVVLPFPTVHGVLKARILTWFAIPFSSGPRFVRTLHRNPSILGALRGMAHGFIELDKAVVHEIRLVKFSVSVVFNLSAL